MLVSDVLEEASVVLQELVDESLSGVLRRRVLGRLEDHPASSCQALLAGGVTISDYYWLRAGNGSSVSVFCDLTSDFDGMATRGFMRAAHLDMSEPLSRASVWTWPGVPWLQLSQVVHLGCSLPACVWEGHRLPVLQHQCFLCQPV